MSENSELQRNKRKRKKSFMMNARKYAKKGHFGCGSQLESDTYNYYVKIMEVYREGFENDEDKSKYCQNFYHCKFCNLNLLMLNVQTRKNYERNEKNCIC